MLFLCFAFSLQAQDFRVSVGLNATRQPQISFVANLNFYYAVYRTTSLTDLTRPIAVFLATNSNATFVDTNAPGQSYFYRVRQVPLVQPLDLDNDGIDDVYELRHSNFLDPLNPSDAALDFDQDGATNVQEYRAGTDPTLAPPGGRLVINEVDYDNVGTDSNEFIELYNNSPSPIDLNNLSIILVNGANNAEYDRFSLSGTLAPRQFLVLASFTGTVTNDALVLRVFGTNGLQNGAPDGLALFDTKQNVLLDALSYEGSITAAIFNGVPGTFNLVEGTVLPASVADSNTINGSLVRLPNGADSNNAATDWRLSNTPTPGAANLP